MTIETKPKTHLLSLIISKLHFISCKMADAIITISSFKGGFLFCFVFLIELYSHQVTSPLLPSCTSQLRLSLFFYDWDHWNQLDISRIFHWNKIEDYIKWSCRPFTNYFKVTFYYRIKYCDINRTIIGRKNGINQEFEIRNFIFIYSWMANNGIHP